jgi:hypothetical protein
MSACRNSPLIPTRILVDMQKAPHRDRNIVVRLADDSPRSSRTDTEEHDPDGER